MSNASTTAYSAGRRQKRLQYWQEWLAASHAGRELPPEMLERLDTYRLLISKLAQIPNAPQQNGADPAGAERAAAERLDAENRLNALDRELTELFESRRLLTSPIGLPAVGNK